jgi:hypothetical protein
MLLVARLTQRLGLDNDKGDEWEPTTRYGAALLMVHKKSDAWKTGISVRLIVVTLIAVAQGSASKPLEQKAVVVTEW